MGGTYSSGDGRFRVRAKFETVRCHVHGGMIFVQACYFLCGVVASVSQHCERIRETNASVKKCHHHRMRVHFRDDEMDCSRSVSHVAMVV